MDAFSQRVKQLTQRLGADAPDYSQDWRPSGGGPTAQDWGAGMADKFKSGGYESPEPSQAPTEGTPRGYEELVPGYIIKSSYVSTPEARAYQLAKYEERMANAPPRMGAYALDFPSTVYAARGLTISASSTGWDSVPVASFGDVDIYKHAAAPTFYILGPEGQFASYQWNHKRLYVGQEPGSQTTKYPSWMGSETKRYIQGMGGLVSDPFYSRSITGFRMPS